MSEQHEHHDHIEHKDPLDIVELLDQYVTPDTAVPLILTAPDVLVLLQAINAGGYFMKKMLDTEGKNWTPEEVEQEILILMDLKRVYDALFQSLEDAIKDGKAAAEAQ